MLKQANKHKWWLGAILTMALICAVLKQSPRVDGPGDSSDNPQEHSSLPNSSYRIQPELSRDATDASNFYIDAEEANWQLSSTPLPRWGQQDIMPDMIQPPTGGPYVPRESVVKESKATSAEAQLTLQMFLSKLTWQEKMMVLRMLAKFSPGEMLEVFQLYKQGSRQAYRNLDAIVMAKVSEADFEKLRALVAKYR